MSDLRLFLLGAHRLERDSAPLALDTRKALALLAYLALTRQAHSREAGRQQDVAEISTALQIALQLEQLHRRWTPSADDR